MGDRDEGLGGERKRAPFEIIAGTHVLKRVTLLQGKGVVHLGGGSGRGGDWGNKRMTS